MMIIGSSEEILANIKANNMSGKHFVHNTSLYKKEPMEEDTELEYLDKLIEDHWHYIAGILQFTSSDAKEIGYHYKTAFRHGWRHAKEHFTGSV